MPFKFIHSSDWHFGATRNLTPRSEEYLDRFRYVFDQIIQKAREPDIDFVLVSGDIFENRATTIPEFILAIQIFRELGQICPVICTAGNHDELQKGQFQSYWLELIGIPNVTFVSKPTQIYMDLKNGGRVGILAMPWTGIKDQDEFDKLILGNLNPDTEIVMLHECFNGSMLDNGKRYPGGVVVPDIPGVKYFALGDIHKMQQMHVPHAWFCGAPLQYTFGDREEKGMLIVTGHQDKPYEVKFNPLESKILLKKITDEKKAVAPHWYSLYCAADQIPLVHNPLIKKINPQPIQVVMPEAIQDGEELQAHQISIDYAEGADQILEELQYTAEEIKQEMDEIRKIAARVGA